MLLAAAVAGCPQPVNPVDCHHADILPADFMRHAEFLGSEALGGRMSATAGNLQAADYIAGRFAEVGLSPAGDDRTWFQSFEIESIRMPHPACCLQLEGDEPFRPGEDFSPMARGTEGVFNAPLVFAGYGLNNRIRGYDDYENISARGAVVLVMQGEPHDGTGQSKWAVRGRWTRLSGIRYKIRKAAENGAVGVLVVTPPDISPQDDPLYDVLGPADGELPAMRISRRTADRLLARAGDAKTLASLAEQINTTSKPASFAVGCGIRGTCRFLPGKGRNVAGVLKPDAGADAGEYVLVGAHYDHLPASGQHARDSGFGVRPGADDNASGVSALITLAGAMASMPQRRVTYVFVAFDAEEIGFLGSKHYALHPALPLEDCSLVVVIDQVGRLRDNKLMLIGDTCYEQLARAIAAAGQAETTLKTVSIPIKSGRRWSDTAPFVAAGKKTLLIHTGLHSDYHRMTDTTDRLNPEGAVCVTGYVMDILLNFESQSK